MCGRRRFKKPLAQKKHKLMFCRNSKFQTWRQGRIRNRRPAKSANRKIGLDDGETRVHVASVEGEKKDSEISM